MTYNFKVAARTLFQLGSEAITNEVVAVSELVKNAYDADSKCCEIKFIYGSELSNLDEFEKIIITDDGFGMSKNDIVSKWLKVGTDSKIEGTYQNKKKTPRGRLPIGEKGVGRLAINRLGLKVDLYSKKENENEVYLSVNFNDFRGNDNVEDIRVEVRESETKEIETLSGTKIVITDLVDNWDKTKLEELYRSIQTLQNPFDTLELNSDNDIVYKAEKQKKIDFQVKLEPKELLSENLTNFEIKNSLFRFQAIIDTANDNYKYTYTLHPYEAMGNFDKRKKQQQQSYLYLDKQEKDLFKSKSKRNLGIIKINLFAYDFSSEINRKAPYNTQVNVMKALVKSRGGISVYRDGHRVYNYGTVGNDWLELDVKRLNRPSRNLSNNVMFGVVSLDLENTTLLQEKTNREGFVDSPESLFLKSIVQAVVADFSSEVEQDKYKFKKMYSPVEKRFGTSEEEYRTLVEKIDSLDKVDEKEKEELKSGLVLYNKQFEYIKKILINVSVNALDFWSLFHDLEKQLDGLEHLITVDSEKNQILENLSEMKELIHGTNELIKQKKSQKYPVNELIEKTMYMNRFYLKRNDVNLTIDLQETEEIYFKIMESDFRRIVYNIINNSVYWLGTASTDRQINIKTRKQQDEIYIEISDNGPGFSKDFKYLLEPFVSTKTDGGIGLGLYIIETLVAKHGGSLEIDNQSNIKGGSARVILKFKEDLNGE